MYIKVEISTSISEYFLDFFLQSKIIEKNWSFRQTTRGKCEKHDCPRRVSVPGRVVVVQKQFHVVRRRFSKVKTRSGRLFFSLTERFRSLNLTYCMKYSE